MAATALGRAEDVPARSLAALRDSALAIFEEDRPARQFLKAAGIHRPYLKFSEHRQEDTLDELRQTLKRGETAVYMSDQGTPGLADPGRELVALAYEIGARVLVIPGPSSLTAAIAACPFDCRTFRFAGFPPREPEDRERWLADVTQKGEAVAMMDTPYRLEALISACKKALPQGWQGFLALDISGEAEQCVAAPWAELAGIAAAADGKLNFVLIIAKPGAPARPGKR